MTALSPSQADRATLAIEALRAAAQVYTGIGEGRQHSQAIRNLADEFQIWLRVQSGLPPT